MGTSEGPAATALEIARMAGEGNFQAVFARLAPPLQTLVTPAALRAAWEAEIDRHGEFRSVGEPLTGLSQPGVAIVKVPVTCTRGGLTLVVSVTESGVVTSLQLAPAEAAAPVEPWQPPAYADPSAFSEREVTLGSGMLRVRGSLSVPAAPGRHPAVVLLGGSGPVDRDETIGPNKPLKDLAWGLASSGVAVVRYDKVTFAHAADVRGMVRFTLTDEYVPHALSAIETLRGDPAVDPGRVFVAGHSLGGTAAPRVATADHLVLGLAILAGGAAPLHRAIVRQFRYLASLNPPTAAISEQTIAVLERQANLIDSDKLSPSTRPADLPLGTPPSYWLDLRDYNPVATAASLGRPILLAQGGRDYQATVEDDLARWQAGLAGRPGVTVRLYPEDDHLFFPGSGPSTPADYDAPQHVDPRIVRDVATWIQTTH